jgi:hypothetical protein
MTKREPKNLPASIRQRLLNHAQTHDGGTVESGPRGLGKTQLSGGSNR